MNTPTTKTRNPAGPRTPSARDDEGRAPREDRGRTRSVLLKPLRWLRDKLSSAVGWVRAQITSPAHLIRSLPPRAVGRVRAQIGRGRTRSVLLMPLRLLRATLSRAVGWVRAQVKSPVHLIKSLFMATIGKDRGFGFWWLMATVAIGLAVGLLVAVLLSPVIGILAALIVAIWMLVRRSRSSQSRKAVSRRSRKQSVALSAG